MAKKFINESIIYSVGGQVIRYRSFDHRVEAQPVPYLILCLMQLGGGEDSLNYGKVAIHVFIRGPHLPDMFWS